MLEGNNYCLWVKDNVDGYRYILLEYEIISVGNAYWVKGI